MKTPLSTKPKEEFTGFPYKYPLGLQVVGEAGA